MNRILKVFCSGADQDRFAEAYPVMERYDGFVLAEVASAEAQAISERYPVEDITDLYSIRVGEQEIDTSQPRVDDRGKQRSHPAYKGAKRLTSGPHHYIVQFIGPIKEQWLKQVKKASGEPRTPLGGFCYVVRADDEARGAIAALDCVRWVGHLRHEDRIAPTLLAKTGLSRAAARELPRTRTFPDTYTVEFFHSKDMKAGLAAIKELGYEILSEERKAAVATIHDPAGSAGAAKRLQALSAVHGVRAIRELTLRRPSNDVAAVIMGSQSALAAPGLGLSGEGEIVAVCDTGLDTGDAGTIHRDFSGRVEAMLSYPIAPMFSNWITNPQGDDGSADLDSGHGTHVAGSVLGDGTVSRELAGVTAPIRGLAHRARLVFQAVEQEMIWRNPADLQRYGRYLLTGIPADLRNLFDDAYQRGARIHSNSWGGGDPGAYDEQCEQLDQFVWTHKDFCVLFANGNDGTDADGDGAINAMSVTSPATAKNCISVGASENLRPNFTSAYGDWWPRDYPAAPYRTDPMADDAEHIVAFSSRGPTADGRIKPDVVAPGTFILSTRSTMIAANNMAWAGFAPSRLYFHMGGTSMATPLAAGAVTLVREYLRRQRQIESPSAALLKAALIAGASRLPHGPAAIADNDQGFGRVNLDAVLAPQPPAEARFLEQEAGLRTGEVFTLLFSVASRGVPLRVVLAYSDFPGPNLINNLNLILQAPDGVRFVGNQSSGAALTMDVNNNVEVVQVVNPLPGEWSLQVVASNIPQGPQPFALVLLAHLGEPGQSEDLVEAEATPGLSIPDNQPQGVSSVLTIARTGRIAGVRVEVDIEHTFIGDLRLWLTAPDNQRLLLHDRAGGSAHHIQRSFDLHTTPALADLLGGAAAGDWQLTVADHAERDVGTLRRWRLVLTLSGGDPFRADSAPGIPIPDNDPQGIQDRVELSGSGTVREIKVSVDITHTWIGDLRVSLEGPSGTRVVLHNRSGGALDNIIKTYDSASFDPLRPLTGEPVAGVWTLHVADLAGRDVGKLNAWGLQVMP